MDNKECAEMFCKIIKEIASKPDNLENLEWYLSHHFDFWLKYFANTPIGLVAELKEFAEMKF